MNHAFATVEIWLVDLMEIESAPRLITLLDEHEQQRWGRLREPVLANAFLRGHAALRQLLSLYAQQPLQSIQYCFNQWGKPYLASGPYFSFSHSHGLAIIAISKSEVGVDLEYQLDDRVSWQALLSMWSEAEARYWQQQSQRPSFNECLRHWTRKEALLKALGFGLSLPLSDVAISFRDAPMPIRAWVRVQNRAK